MTAFGKLLTFLEAEGRNLIGKGLYQSEEEFVRDLVRELSRSKVAAYQSSVNALEERHISWEECNRKLSGTATPEREDGWMEWETARDRLEAWRKLEQEL